MVSYAMLCGVPAMAAVSIYSVEGLVGLGDRLLGVLADRLGVKLVLVAGLLVQSLVYRFVERRARRGGSGSRFSAADVAVAR